MQIAIKITNRKELDLMNKSLNCKETMFPAVYLIMNETLRYHNIDDIPFLKSIGYTFFQISE